MQLYNITQNSNSPCWVINLFWGFIDSYPVAKLTVEKYWAFPSWSSKSSIRGSENFLTAFNFWYCNLWRSIFFVYENNGTCPWVSYWMVGLYIAFVCRCLATSEHANNKWCVARCLSNWWGISCINIHFHPIGFTSLPFFQGEHIIVFF